MSTKSALPVAGRAAVAVLLLLYDLLALFVALAWGPGNSDEIVTGGIVLAWTVLLFSLPD